MIIESQFTDTCLAFDDHRCLAFDDRLIHARQVSLRKDIDALVWKVATESVVKKPVLLFYFF
mgnify:CR=1 FL=1